MLGISKTNSELSCLAFGPGDSNPEKTRKLIRKVFRKYKKMIYSLFLCVSNINFIFHGTGYMLEKIQVFLLFQIFLFIYWYSQIPVRRRRPWRGAYSTFPQFHCRPVSTQGNILIEHFIQKKQQDFVRNWIASHILYWIILWMCFPHQSETRWEGWPAAWRWLSTASQTSRRRSEIKFDWEITNKLNL